MKGCARRFVLLKLNTDRHEASRGLFATAELLVVTELILEVGQGHWRWHALLVCSDHVQGRINHSAIYAMA